MADIVFGNDLDRLAYEYGTDKCPQIKHGYTPFYYDLLKDKRQTIKKVLEMGIGYYDCMKHVGEVWDKRLKRNYKRGASLKMWRDFFPNAQIYGADIKPDTMFEDERIKTFLCDETKKEDIENLVKQTGSDIDLFVDDGSHRKEDQIFLCQTIKPLLKDDVIYIIEDVGFPDHMKEALFPYHCHVPRIRSRWPKSRLMVVRNRR